MNKIEELVKHSKGGNIRAKEELIMRLKPLIISSIKRYYYGNMPFEDLVQEGYMKILMEIQRFNERKGVPFLGYIKTHLRYLYLELSRRKEELLILNNIVEEGIEAIDLQRSEFNLEENFLELETINQLIKAFKALTDRQKLILNLIYSKGLSMKDIAVKLGIHYQTVIGIRDRGLKRLRREL